MSELVAPSRLSSCAEVSFMRTVAAARATAIKRVGARIIRVRRASRARALRRVGCSMTEEAARVDARICAQVLALGRTEFHRAVLPSIATAAAIDVATFEMVDGSSGHR